MGMSIPGLVTWWNPAERAAIAIAPLGQDINATESPIGSVKNDDLLYGREFSASLMEDSEETGIQELFFFSEEYVSWMPLEFPTPFVAAPKEQVPHRGALKKTIFTI